MRSLSNWAKSHVRLTRFLFVFIIYPLLNTTGFLLGIILGEEGWNPGDGFYWLSIAALILFVLFQPGKPGSRKAYWQQRLVHVLFAAVTFGMVTLTAMKWNAPATVSFQPVHASVLTGHETKVKVSKEKKEKKLLRQLKKKWSKASNGEKAVLVVLAILIGVALILLIGALACSIACSGLEALGYAVFIAGTVGVIIGLIAVIRRIKHGPRKKEKNNSSS
jgi:hypothetical protein